MIHADEFEVCVLFFVNSFLFLFVFILHVKFLINNHSPIREYMETSGKRSRHNGDGVKKKKLRQEKRCCECSPSSRCARHAHFNVDFKMTGSPL